MTMKTENKLRCYTSICDSIMGKHYGTSVEVRDNGIVILDGVDFIAFIPSTGIVYTNANAPVAMCRNADDNETQ